MNFLNNFSVIIGMSWYGFASIFYLITNIFYNISPPFMLSCYLNP